MWDLDRAKILMRPSYAAAREVVKELDHIVARNQNDCTGDGSITERQWSIIKDCAGHLRLFKELAECLGE